MKKYFAILLALVLALAMSTSAMAATITITPPGETDKGITYKAYKIFDAIISDGNVFYTMAKDSPYYTTVNSSGYFDLSEQTINGVTVYVVTGKTTFTASEAATLAGNLKTVADTQTPTATVTYSDTTKYRLDVEDGYYLVTSTVGTKLMLDTINTTAIQDKNQYPSITKTVSSATADKGSDVTFTIQVAIPANASGEIVVHDKMTGLEYQSMTAVEGITEGTDPTCDNECNVHFTLTEDYVTANLGKTVTITYTAKVTADTAENEAYLVDDSYTSTTVTVDVENYKIDVFKYTMEGQTKTGLAGAGFVLKNANGKYYNFTDNAVTWVDSIENATELKTGADNKYIVTFEGLASGTYTLVEKTVPAGYNPAADQDVTITDDNKTGESQIEVLNNHGSQLPSTGGMGTTVFYVVGGMMVCAALVLLVAKKKTSYSR